MLINTWKALFLEHLAIKSSIIDKKTSKITSQILLHRQFLLLTKDLKKGFMSLNLMELAKLWLPNILIFVKINL